MVTWSFGALLALLAAKQGVAPGTAKPIPGLPPAARYEEQGEITYIRQAALPFHSRYQAQNSYPPNGVAAGTEIVVRSRFYRFGFTSRFELTYLVAACLHSLAALLILGKNGNYRTTIASKAE